MNRGAIRARMIGLAMASGHAAERARKPAAPRPDQLLFVKAEGFAQRGGWVVDPQFMD